MKSLGNTTEAKSIQTLNSMSKYGYAHDITPEESDAISDNTAFIWQTSGGSANIPAKSTAIVKKIGGNTMQSSTDGKQYPFKAAALLSRIYNLFDYEDESQKRVGYVLNSDGSISADSDSTLFWVKVLAGENGGNNGYCPTPAPELTLSDIGWNYCGFTTEEPDEETASVTLIERSTHGNSNSYLPAYNGWLVFSLDTAHEQDLCLHLCWSGYNDDVFGSYGQDLLNLPEICSTRGLHGIGSVYDEINQTSYIQRIGEVDSSSLSWQRWTERVYNPSTQEYEDQFIGYKAYLGNIAPSTTTIITDNVYQLSYWQSDEYHTLKVMADSEDAEILAQLTAGINIYYELENPIVVQNEFSTLITVGDFGDMRFLDVQTVEQGMSGTYPVTPATVEIKYGVNYRDTVRGISNSRVIFDKNGVKTSGLFRSPDVSNVTVSGTLLLSTIVKMMKFTLAGSSNTIVLPNQQILGDSAFSCQCKIIQDTTGGRNLYFVMDDGNGSTVNIKNPSEVDFSVGTANQSCIATLLYDGDGTWWIEATNYVD